MKRITLAFLVFIAVAVSGLCTTHDIALAQGALEISFNLQCVEIDGIPPLCPLPTCCLDTTINCIGDNVANSEFSADCRECGGRVAVDAEPCPVGLIKCTTSCF